MTVYTGSSAAAWLLGACLLLGCGGEADTSPQNSAAAGTGGSGAGGNGAGGMGRGGRHAGGTGADGGALGGAAGASVGPATHVDACDRICARAADAGCSQGSDSCVIGCATVTGFSGCQSQIGAWLDCAETAPLACDASGAPTFSGCETQLAQAAACAVTTTPPTQVQSSCGSYCDQIEAAGCVATTQLGECRQSCGLAGMLLSTCQPSFLAYVNCAAASGEPCDASGQPSTSVCAAQQFTYMGCVLSEIGSATALTGTGGTAAQ